MMHLHWRADNNSDEFALQLLDDYATVALCPSIEMDLFLGKCQMEFYDLILYRKRHQSNN